MKPFRAGLVLISLSCAVFAKAQSAPAAQAAAECKAFFEKHKIVGMSVAVIHQGKEVFATQLGDADRESKRAVRPNTLFRLASVSKPITAVAVMKLVEEGSLSLEASARQYLPQLPDSPPFTLAQLLSHTAGVRHYQGDADPSSEVFSYFKTCCEACSLFTKDPFIAKPGEKYSYSTHAYTLIGAAIEKASGHPFWEYMRLEIFPHAGSGLDVELSIEGPNPRRSQVYGQGDKGMEQEPKREDNSWKLPGGGMESSALALARFGAALLDGKIISEASMKRMWTPSGVKGGGEGYGLGWGVNGDVVGHNGGQQGSRTSFYMDTKTKTIAVVLCNTGANYVPDALAKKLIALFAPK